MTGVEDLTPAELSQFKEAVLALRDAIPPHTWTYSIPVRNPRGVLNEVQALECEGGRIVADVAIRANGSLGPVRMR